MPHDPIDRLTSRTILALAADRRSCWRLAPAAGVVRPGAAGRTPTPTKTPRPASPTTTADAASPSLRSPDCRRDNASNRAAASTAELPSASCTAPAAAPTRPPCASPAPTRARRRPRRSQPNGSCRSPDYGVQAFLWWRRGGGRPRSGADQGCRVPLGQAVLLLAGHRGRGQGPVRLEQRRPHRRPGREARPEADRARQPGSGPALLGGQCRRENAAHFADFLAAVATRYKGRIQAYQIWNEPNLAREWGRQRPDPAGYARMLKTAYSAIKGIDPQRDRRHRGHGAHRHGQRT